MSMTDKKYIQTLEEENENLSDVIIEQMMTIHALEKKTKDVYVMGYITNVPNYYVSSTINP